MKKVIPIPHIGYTVIVRTANKEELAMMLENGWYMYCERTDTSTSTIIMQDKKITDKNRHTLAHEALHALQNISKDRGINMTNEQEHFAYMLHYILNMANGYHYNF